MEGHKYIADGWVWHRKADYAASYLNHIRRVLTCYPKATSEHSKGDPPPIRLYEDRRDVLGVPRGWFMAQGHSRESIIERVSDGAPISDDVESLMRFEGPFREQAHALSIMQDYMGDKGLGGFLLQAGCALP